jgi:hypothetical protein
VTDAHNVEKPPRVHTEEEVDRTSSSCLFECLIEPLISRIGGAPYLILERFLYVVFSIRFDYKVARLKERSENKVKVRKPMTNKRWARIKILRVITLVSD